MKNLFALTVYLSLVTLLSSCDNSNQKLLAEKDARIAELEALLEGSYSQKDLADSEVYTELKGDSTVYCNTGDRITFSKAPELLFREISNYKKNHVIHLPNPANQKKVVTTTSYSFGLCSLIDLLDDINTYNSINTDSITGIRIQTYIKNINKAEDFIDAAIIPTKKDGSLVYSAVLSNKKMANTAETSLVLNISLPCPDLCDN
ncbi:MAG: hypothetical protein OEY56_04350 [Cyclobacteriaceae bacterium]|nr:hypothetical protein [Cyclobacteriaceae bacterium]